MSKNSLKIIERGCTGCLLCDHGQQLLIASESSNLSRVRDQIRLIGEHCSLSDHEIFDIQVAVGEAVANAIEHGSPEGTDNCVEITTNCDGEFLLIIVKDEGRFIRRMPDPAPDAETNFRGRGIPLMLALMDRVTIDEAARGTQVVLMKRLSNRGDE
ncbi:MAG TPA: ATP-binding protein [Candidatus Aquicultor sp.]